MRYACLIICCFITLTACNKFKEDLPIDREKLINVLIDAHVAEAAMQELPAEKRDSIGKIYYKKIFESHKVTEADFNKSIFIIRRDPEALEILYKEVIAALEKKEEEARK